MEYANIQVAIGGDTGNTVPKFFVPASEIALLLAIHGPDSLFDFEPVEAPADAEDLSDSEELQRLRSIYGHVTDGEGEQYLKQVYPGAGAKVVRTLDALEIPEGAYKVLERVSAKGTKKAASSSKSTTKADDKPSVMD